MKTFRDKTNTFVTTIDIIAHLYHIIYGYMTKSPIYIPTYTIYDFMLGSRVSLARALIIVDAAPSLVYCPT